MQRKQAVTIKLTEINKLIFDHYEAARPQKSDGLALQASFAIVQPNSENEGLFAKMAAKVTDTVIAGELGAMGGQMGVGVGVGMTLVKTYAGHLFERADKDELIQIVNLNYLEPAEFIGNPQIGDTPEQSKNRLDAFKKLYHHALTYQKLKGTRFGFKLFGIKFGDYRDDDLIDDPKYLVNILIGRKIRFAAEAKTKEECELQLRHLLQFLQAIVGNPEITASKSGDTTYLSIRSVINMVKKELNELEDKEAIEADKDSLYVILQKNVGKTVADASKLFNEVTNRATYLTCGIAPADFRHFDPNNTFTSELEISRLLAKKGSYPRALFDALYNGNQAPFNLDVFIAGLKKYTGVSHFKNEIQLKPFFNNIVENKEKLRKLLETLKSFEEIKRAAGLNAFIALSDELAFLLQEIKKIQFTLIKSQKAFADALSVNFSASNEQAFKDAFTQYGYTRLVMDIKPINEAIIALEQISMNKDEKKDELEDNIQRLIGAFHAETLQRGYIPTLQSSPDDHVELEATEATEDDDLKDWVQVNLEQSAVFADQLPKDIKELPWYQKMFNDAELRRQNAALQLVAKEKDAVIAGKDAAIKALTEKKEAAKKARKAAEKAKNTAQEQLAKNEEKDHLNSHIETQRSVFNSFIDDYVKQNRASSIWNFFGNFHGFHGRDVAAFIKSEFNNIIDELKTNDELTIRNLNSVLLQHFINLLARKHDNLDGNFNPHSLKTYLLAYANYLSDVSLYRNISPLHAYHHKIFVKVKRDSEVVEAAYHQKIGVSKLDPSPIDATKYIRQ